MPRFLDNLTLWAQTSAQSLEDLNSGAQWWQRLGNVLFGAVIVLLVISVLGTFWRRSVNKQREREKQKAKSQPAKRPTRQQNLM